MAWRVTPVPAVSLLMETDPSSQRRTTSFNRTVSPKAAKSGTELSNSLSAMELAFLRKVFLDKLDDPTPTLFVGREDFHAARERDLVEAGFGHGEHDAVGNFFQCEFDERGGLVRIIDAGLNGIRVPAKREKAFGFDAVDGDFEGNMAILFLSFGNFRIDGGPYNFSGDVSSRLKWSVELDAEPDSKFHGVG